MFNLAKVEIYSNKGTYVGREIHVCALYMKICLYVTTEQCEISDELFKKNCENIMTFDSMKIWIYVMLNVVTDLGIQGK